MRPAASVPQKGVHADDLKATESVEDESSSFGQNGPMGEPIGEHSETELAFPADRTTTIFCPSSLRSLWPDPLAKQWRDQYRMLFDEDPSSGDIGAMCQMQ